MAADKMIKNILHMNVRLLETYGTTFSIRD